MCQSMSTDYVYGLITLVSCVYDCFVSDLFYQNQWNGPENALS